MALAEELQYVKQMTFHQLVVVVLYGLGAWFIIEILFGLVLYISFLVGLMTNDGDETVLNVAGIVVAQYVRVFLGGIVNIMGILLGVFVGYRKIVFYANRIREASTDDSDNS